MRATNIRRVSDRQVAVDVLGSSGEKIVVLITRFPRGK